jgi:hypothetical protein
MVNREEANWVHAPGGMGVAWPPALPESNAMRRGAQRRRGHRVHGGGGGDDRDPPRPTCALRGPAWFDSSVRSDVTRRRPRSQDAGINVSPAIPVSPWHGAMASSIV